MPGINGANGANRLNQFRPDDLVLMKFYHNNVLAKSVVFSIVLHTHLKRNLHSLTSLYNPIMEGKFLDITEALDWILSYKEFGPVESMGLNFCDEFNIDDEELSLETNQKKTITIILDRYTKE